MDQVVFKLEVGKNKLSDMGVHVRGPNGPMRRFECASGGSNVPAYGLPSRLHNVPLFQGFLEQEKQDFVMVHVG